MAAGNGNWRALLPQETRDMVVDAIYDAARELFPEINPDHVRQISRLFETYLLIRSRNMLQYHIEALQLLTILEPPSETDDVAENQPGEDDVEEENPENPDEDGMEEENADEIRRTYEDSDVEPSEEDFSEENESHEDPSGDEQVDEDFMEYEPEEHMEEEEEEEEEEDEEEDEEEERENSVERPRTPPLCCAARGNYDDDLDEDRDN